MHNILVQYTALRCANYIYTGYLESQKETLHPYMSTEIIASLSRVGDCKEVLGDSKEALGEALGEVLGDGKEAQEKRVYDEVRTST